MTRREKFIKEFTEELGQAPPDYMADIVENFTGDFPKMYLYLPFAETEAKLEISKDDDFGFRVLATLYSSPNDLKINNINYRPYELLKETDKNGKSKWQYITEVSEDQDEEAVKNNLEDIACIFGLQHFIAEGMVKAKPLSVEEVVQNDTMNEEIKALLFAHPSMNLSQLLEKVDSYTNTSKKNTGQKDIHYDLFKGKILDVDVTYVRTFDASTDRMFFLAVGNEVTKAKDAPGWLLRVPKELKPLVESINRQGEKYAIVWKDGVDLESEEFKKKQKSELVRFSGEEYFSLLDFES